MWSLPSAQCHEPPSIVLQAFCLSDLIPWIYLSLPMYNHKGFDLGHTWMVRGFPYFFQFKSEFGNKEFMIWATVSSWSCFCWLYRASPSLAAKNIINLISVLTISRQNSIIICPASFCTPRPNLPVTPGISWLTTFAFQSPMMKRTSFFVCVNSRSLVGLHRTGQLQLLWHIFISGCLSL